MREQARKRIAARREVVTHAVVYVVDNGLIVVAWFLTGHDYFWPAWLMAGWGAGLLLQAWDVFWRRPITDADVDAELHRRD
jgi:hypothetical protein